MSTSLFYVPDIILMITMILLGLGIANPWYARESKDKQKAAPEMAQYAAEF